MAASHHDALLVPGSLEQVFRLTDHVQSQFLGAGQFGIVGMGVHPEYDRVESGVESVRMPPHRVRQESGGLESAPAGVVNGVIGPGDRVTMVVEGDDQTLQQMTKQVDKLVNVLQVLDLTQRPAVERELMLLKVSAPAASRGAVIELVQVFRAKVVDVADEALTLEVVGDPGKLVARERLMAPFGILEIARTGKVALERASGVNTEMLKVSPSQSRVPA